jgi:uncharacterized protein (DUF952 family)
LAFQQKALDAHVTKKNLKQAAAEAAVNVDGNTNNSATTVTEYIHKEAKAAVETTAHKLFQKAADFITC